MGKEVEPDVVMAASGFAHVYIPAPEVSKVRQ